MATLLPIASVVALLDINLRVYRQFDRVKTRNNDAHKLQQEVLSMRSVLEEVVRVLEAYTSKENRSSEKMAGENEELPPPAGEALANALQELKKVMEEMETLLDKRSDVHYTTSSNVELKEWLFKVPKLRELMAQAATRTGHLSQVLELISYFNLRNLRPHTDKDEPFTAHTTMPLPTFDVLTSTLVDGTGKLKNNLARPQRNEMLSKLRFYCTYSVPKVLKRRDWIRHEEEIACIQERRNFRPLRRRVPLTEGFGFQAYEITLMTGALAANAVSGVCMLNYDLLHPYGKDLQDYLKLSNAGLAVNNVVNLPQFIMNPSSPVFVAATIVNGLATSSYYNLRKSDRFKDWFLGAGAMVAIGGGIIAGADVQDIFLDMLPFALMISLVLCTVINHGRGCHKVKEPQDLSHSSEWRNEKDEGV